ncbi:type III-B CRISPR module-associated protein Cmr5 [Abyssisolibacter fermentans]|uniref:type III-B CRISPR module-associated protein Cmr5 n=1 Tax=Abyssisolibacter fermentans TaxID=1766203 RepID=UPI00082C2EE5|nr:type III-B CRISPR module-associated protein Cmr5 [Abyssisolibacter fermentans]
MNKRRVEKYIPKAIKIIETYLDENKIIPSEFKGYIASFGASIIQSGLYAAISFYESEDANTNADRIALTLMIKYLLEDKEIEKNDFSKKTLSNNEIRLQKYCIKYLEENNDKEELTDNIIDASIAIKLALSSFKIGR